MKKKVYEAPLTEHTQVELENGFMQASVFEEKEGDHSLPIENQEKGGEFDFSDSKWGWK
ncbi:hypothetical protein [uncultured Bacteroides sp.]|jgi:hypothetical protein|uniref:hypothetical protein n=1 Tax=uncultured Bacteroides sp. TaxID=162156 RepID=UPI00280C1019|nr:hypothetical protein [uncultured Bacteroides sp.]